jgi:predicted metal-binding protein
VKGLLEQELKDCRPPATAEAIRRITDELNLQARYGGRAVACFTTNDGTLAVLAVGEQEVRALFGGLTAAEAANVVIEFPDQF